MAAGKLRQVLSMIEEANGPLSLNSIARSLQVSPGQLQGMLEFWVRKGRIREVEDAKDCSTCGINGNCPFVIDLPRSYELATESIVIPLHSIKSLCEHQVDPCMVAAPFLEDPGDIE